MGAKSIKSELIELIDREVDQEVLNAVYTLLTKTSLDPVLKEELTKRALRSEEDIKEGRLMNQVTFEKKIKDRLGI